MFQLTDDSSSPLRGLATIIRVKDKPVKPIDKVFATEDKTQEFEFHSACYVNVL